jgi:outer membrane protein insertion porin family
MTFTGRRFVRSLRLAVFAGFSFLGCQFVATSAASQDGAAVVEAGPAFDLSAASNTRFLTTYAAQPGVVARPSGMLYRVLEAGDGASIGSQLDRVRVTYSGRLIDGTEFDATQPGQMAEFTANALIPGWVEALAIMSEGDEWELVIPSDLGYGAQGAGGGAIPPNQTLVFTMRLVEVVQEAPLGPPPQIASTAIEGVVETILVEGTQRVEPGSVISYMALRQGTPYDPVAADQSLKTLFETGLFADVRMNWDGTMLTVRVVENPIINQVVFEGDQALSEEDLGEEVQVSPRMVFTRARVQDDVQRIIELYRRSGRFAATVEPTIIQRPQNRVDLIFEINEGPTTGVASINFIGNEIFSDNDLRGQIVTTQSAWYRFLSTDDNYDPDRVTFDRELIRRFYITQGYADFRVVSAVAELSPDRTDFYITFTVEEGEQYTFGNIVIESNIEDLVPEVLLPLVLAQSGEIYNAQEVDDSIEALTFAAGVEGFVFVDILPRVQRNFEGRTIEIFFEIAEAPRVYVERVDIIGNARTRDEVIRREFRLAEGDAFNRVLVDRSRTRIRALGFFSDVVITEEAGSEPDRTALRVEVTEQPTGELSLGAGFSSQDSIIGEFSYTERNLFGRGQFLRASVSYSAFQQNYDIRFTEPYFLGRPLEAGALAYKVRQDFIDQAGFNSDITAIGFLFGFPVSEYARVSPHYNFSIATIRTQLNAPTAVALSGGTASTSAVGYVYTYDTRDNIFRPNTGWLFNFRQDVAGLGGELNWLRTIADVRYWRPIEIFGLDFVGLASLEGGFISSYAGQQIRINERFFRGGPTFRGFEFSGVGPRDLATRSRVALGGQAYVHNTFELRLPQFVPDEYGITLSLFNDFGTLGYLRGVTRECDPVGQFVANPITGQQVFSGGTCIQDNLAPRASAGVSINWNSPFGPVSIDIGYPYIQEAYDRVQAITFRTITNF